MIIRSSHQSLFITLIGACAVTFSSRHGAMALSSPDPQRTKGGWETRPTIPELARSPDAPSAATSSSKKSNEDSSSVAQRESWDPGRFLRQSSRFVTLPNPFARKPGGIRKVSPGDSIWIAGASETNMFGFAPLDDVVMGGVSSSDIDNETGWWRGTVSSANSGGFVGFRSTPLRNVGALDMTKCKGIELKVRGGNGRRFKLVVRDSTDFNGVCWTSSFDGPKIGGISSLARTFGIGDNSNGERGEIVTLRLPFKGQIPAIFARTVPRVDFNVDSVVAFQLAYSKFEYDGQLNPNFELGDFSLQVVQVGAY